MSVLDLATVKTYFERGDLPTEAQFGHLIDTLSGGGQIVSADPVITNHGNATTVGSFAWCISQASAGDTIVLPRGVYSWTHVVVDKRLTIDLGGSTITVDPTDGATTLGNPAIWVKGSIGTANAISAAARGATSITSAGHGAEYAAGDWVLVRSEDVTAAAKVTAGTAVTGLEQITRVVSVAGDVLTLSTPCEYGYTTTPTVAKISMVEGVRIIGGGATFTESDPGGDYSGVALSGGVPHVIHGQYAKDLYVEDVSFSSWQLHAVNFHRCVNARAERIRGRDPIRTTAGRGYMTRWDRCLGGGLSASVGTRVRHLWDVVQGQDVVSMGNQGIDTVEPAFAWHGHSSRRCASIRDAVTGRGAGWYVGNGSFRGDYGAQIVAPSYSGTNVAVTVLGYSEATISDPQIYSSSRGVMLALGATMQVRGGEIEVTGSGSGVNAILARGKEATGDADAVDCGAILIEGVTAKGSSDSWTVNLNSAASIVVRGNHVNDGEYSILVDNEAAPTAVIIEGNRVTGDPTNGIYMDAVPSAFESISDNYVEGYGALGIFAQAIAGMRVTNNYADPGTGGGSANNKLTFGGDLAAAIGNGARVTGNNMFTANFLSMGQKYRANLVWDPGSLADGAGETSGAIAVTGAVLGADTVVVVAPYDLQGIICTGYIRTTNEVRIRLQNETGAPIDLIEGTWKVYLLKP